MKLTGNFINHSPENRTYKTGGHLLSIIIPTFNSSVVLREALDSILFQKYNDYEIWIMDGASTDDTVAIIKEYQLKHDTINYVSEKDSGIYDAMNKGAGLAGGKWLYFMGSDDRLYDNDVLADLSKVLQHSKADMTYGDVFRKEDNQVYGGRFSYHKLMSKNICHQAVFIKKEIFERYGPFNIKFRALADHELNLTLFKNGIKTKYIKRLIAAFGARGYSSTYYDTAFVERFEEIYNGYKKNIINRIRLKLDIMLENIKAYDK